MPKGVRRVDQSAPVHFGGRELDHKWRWKDRYDNFRFPREMQTRHLFYTLRMIWNNCVPPRMRVGEVNLYEFKPFYTRSYMRSAVIQIGRELYRRDDMTPKWKEELRQMEAWFAEWDPVDDSLLPHQRRLPAP